LRCNLRTARASAPILATALTFLTGCSDPAEPPNWQAALDYADSEMHAIAIGRQGYPLIEIQVNGRAVEVLLDTGNMTGLFLAEDVIRRLGLPELGEAVTRDSDGNPTGERPTFAAASVTAFGHHFADREILQRNQREIDGAIGREIYIQVDTGKTRSCVDPEFARQAGLHETGNGYRIDSLEIGSLRFAVPSAKGVGFGGISHDLDAPILASIGSDILKEFVLTVDVDQAVVFIQRH
jgi:hypothetical protein